MQRSRLEWRRSGRQPSGATSCGRGARLRRARARAAGRGADPLAGGDAPAAALLGGRAGRITDGALPLASGGAPAARRLRRGASRVADGLARGRRRGAGSPSRNADLLALTIRTRELAGVLPCGADRRGRHGARRRSNAERRVGHAHVFALTVRPLDLAALLSLGADDRGRTDLDLAHPAFAYPVGAFCAAVGAPLAQIGERAFAGCHWGRCRARRAVDGARRDRLSGRASALRRSRWTTTRDEEKTGDREGKERANHDEMPPRLATL